MKFIKGQNIIAGYCTKCNESITQLEMDQKLVTADGKEHLICSKEHIALLIRNEKPVTEFVVRYQKEKFNPQIIIDEVAKEFKITADDLKKALKVYESTLLCTGDTKIKRSSNESVVE